MSRDALVLAAHAEQSRDAYLQWSAEQQPWESPSVADFQRWRRITAEHN